VVPGLVTSIFLLFKYVSDRIIPDVPGVTLTDINSI